MGKIRTCTDASRLNSAKKSAGMRKHQQPQHQHPIRYSVSEHRAVDSKWGASTHSTGVYHRWLSDHCSSDFINRKIDLDKAAPITGEWRNHKPNKPLAKHVPKQGRVKRI
jgi:hypothetical protein